MAWWLLSCGSGRSMIIQKQVLEKSGIPLFKKLLHITSSSQKLVADNVAHVSTPGYKSKSIDFKKEMESALKKQRVPLQITDAHHIPAADKPSNIRVITNDDDSELSGVNNVDIDKEMGALAENQILYSFGARMALNKFNALKSVIKGRS